MGSPNRDEPPHVCHRVRTSCLVAILAAEFAVAVLALSMWETRDGRTAAGRSRSATTCPCAVPEDVDPAFPDPEAQLPRLPVEAPLELPERPPPGLEILCVQEVDVIRIRWDGERALALAYVPDSCCEYSPFPCNHDLTSVCIREFPELYGRVRRLRRIVRKSGEPFRWAYVSLRVRGAGQHDGWYTLLSTGSLLNNALIDAVRAGDNVDDARDRWARFWLEEVHEFCNRGPDPDAAYHYGLIEHAAHMLGCAGPASALGALQLLEARVDGEPGWELTLPIVEAAQIQLLLRQEWTPEGAIAAIRDHPKSWIGDWAQEHSVRLHGREYIAVLEARAGRNPADEMAAALLSNARVAVEIQETIPSRPPR